jgi:lysophospholipase L1-like esterase
MNHTSSTIFRISAPLLFGAALLATALAADGPPRTTVPEQALWKGAVETWTPRCAARVAAMKGKPCDIIFIGDSITQHFQDQPTPGWKLVGGPVWEKYYGRRNVLNFGVAGDTTQNVLWRLENMDIRAFRPKVAVVMLGMNHQNDTPEDTAAGVEAVIAKTRSLFPGVKTIAVSVTPNGRMPEKTLRINELIRKLADGRDVFYLDLYSKMPRDGDGWKGVGYDKIHLTEAGYEIWAAELEPLFKRLGLAAPK